MEFYRRTIRRLFRTRPLRWVMSRILTPLDLKFKGSRFAPSAMGLDLPLCFLTTTGRRSGELRTSPLLFVETDSGAPAIAASNFGRKARPEWALNLEANPSATLEIDGDSRAVTARRASAETTAQLWPRFDDVWPGYEDYRETADRNIRIFILE